MAKTVYALLVGINEYPTPVRQLDGCVNDVRAVEAYLKGRIGEGNFKLAPRILTDGKAKRAAVIDGFRKHLAKADKNDVAFFYYSGHGSYEDAPEEFLEMDPSGKNETLVCWDSRMDEDNPCDIADKELAVLIAEVAASGAHVVVVLDCCHAGSGTRDIRSTKVRQIAKAKWKRKLSSYIVSLDQFEILPATRSLESNRKRWAVREGRHLLLAACQRQQSASEYFANNKSCGAFTYFLLDTLERSSDTPSYRDLMKRTEALVKGNVADQWPQLEVSESKDMDRPFLGGAVTARSGNFIVKFDREYGWVLDAGALHGISVGADGETTVLAVFPYDSDLSVTTDLSGAFGEAVVTEVLPQLSKIEIKGINDPSAKEVFKAVVISLPLPRQGVRLEEDPKAGEMARESLNKIGPNGRPSLYICEEDKTPVYRLVARKATEKDNKPGATKGIGIAVGKDAYFIYRTTDEYPLLAPIAGYSEESADKAVKSLEHLARWKNIRELENNGTLIAKGDIEMTVSVDGKEKTNPALILKYKKENNKLVQPTFKVALKNNSQRAYYCALLFISEEFGVSAEAFPTGGIWIEPGEIKNAMQGNDIFAKVPKPLRDVGVTRYSDWLKLIVCTTQFDAFALELPSLEVYLSPKTKGEDEIGYRSLPICQRQRTTLNRLIDRTKTRTMSDRPEEDEMYSDWTTKQISITTTVPE